MTDDWDEVRSRRETIRESVDRGGPPPAVSATAGRGGLKPAGTPVTITGDPGAGKTMLYGALT